MPFAQSNGIRLYYEDHGRGEPLLLIAGIGYDVWMWRRMVPALAERFRVIAFDNRGAGQSDKPPGPYSAAMLADDTAGLMDALGLPKAHVLGHSMGGFVAQALAINYPARVDRLILAATTFGGPRHIPITPEAMAVLADVSGDPVERLRRGIEISCAPEFAEQNPALVEEWVAYRIAHPIDPPGYQAQLAVGLSLLAEAASFEGKLAAVRSPVLILFGARDRVVPRGNAELLATRLPDAHAVQALGGDPIRLVEVVLFQQWPDAAAPDPLQLRLVQPIVHDISLTDAEVFIEDGFDNGGYAIIPDVGTGVSEPRVIISSTNSE